MNTIEKNEAIAKFMEASIKPDGIYRWRVNDRIWASEGLKYNSSWDWLMPVVEREDCKTRN